MRRVNEFYEQVVDVDVNSESASAFFIVPGKFYACIQISFTIIGDVVMFFEDIAEMMGMLFSNTFKAKVIYN